MTATPSQLTRVDVRQSDGCIVLLPECTITIRSDAVQPETQIVVSEPLDTRLPLGQGPRMQFRWRWFDRFGSRPAQLAIMVRQP